MEINREKFSFIPFFSRFFFFKIILDNNTNSVMFHHGDKSLTPKLLSTFVKIVEREVRGSIPVRDDGNFAGGDRFTSSVKLVHCQSKRRAIRISLSLCFIISWIRNYLVFKFIFYDIHRGVYYSLKRNIIINLWKKNRIKYANSRFNNF